MIYNKKKYCISKNIFKLKKFYLRNFSLRFKNYKKIKSNGSNVFFILINNNNNNINN